MLLWRYSCETVYRLDSCFRFQCRDISIQSVAPVNHYEQHLHSSYMLETSRIKLRTCALLSTHFSNCSSNKIMVCHSRLCKSERGLKASAQQWRLCGSGEAVSGTETLRSQEQGQFTVWLYPLSSEWSVAARGPAWSHRSPWCVVAPALSSPRSLWPLWPSVLLF